MQAIDRAENDRERREREILDLAAARNEAREIMTDSNRFARSITQRRRQLMEQGNNNIGGRQFAGQMFVIRFGANGRQIISVADVNDRMEPISERRDIVASESSNED
jgi:hypothetical protein